MNKQGFTLIEILIVISLVAFLSTSMFVGFENYTQRSSDLRARNSVIEFINKSQNYINFENWKDSADKKLIFLMNSEEFSLKDGDVLIFGSDSFNDFELNEGSLRIEFDTKQDCSLGDGVQSTNLVLENKEGRKALEIFSDNKNCYIEILKI
ncbi:type II secretion system protein [bacterium]|jgi:prepilin-type N-terminal cleavage/methylation domain-containing protein|nr:type II secretion system protein [bacterium]MBT6293363.1 type II secretion system protein [bacterium]